MTTGKENSTLARIFLHNGDGPPMEGDNASTGVLKIDNDRDEYFVEIIA